MLVGEMDGNPKELRNGMADLSGDIGLLKLAAIDAAMRRRDYVAQGSFYVFSWNGVPGSVTRPGADGHGGGEVLAVPSQHPRAGAPESVVQEAKAALTAVLTEEFEQIRHSIDSALEPWLKLPSAGTVELAAGGCDKLLAGLMGAVAQTGSVVSGAGELASRLGRMSQESTSFGGGAFDTFKARYIDDSPLRAVRLTALAEVMGQAIFAEAEIWRRVEVDLAETLSKYRIGFAALAAGGQPNASLTFSVVGAAIAGAALFASGGGAIALSGAGIVVGLAESISAAGTPGSPAREELLFGDVVSGLESFGASLRELSQRIHEQESRVIDGVSDAIVNVRDNATLFQLTPAGIASASNDGTMYANPQQNLSLARTHIPNAAQAVEAVVGLPGAVEADLQSALERSFAVGWRLHGASSRIADLGNLLEALLKEFAWDLSQGARNLELAILDWADAEGQNVELARGLAAQIDGGATHDGRASEELLDIPRTTNKESVFTNLRELMRGSSPTSPGSE